MKTRYIFTEKAEQIARNHNIPEYRKAGTAAYFAYKPLEESHLIAQAWIDAGIIKETKEPVNFLTFTLKTTAANAIYKLFRENNIKFKSDHETFFEIYADINGTGDLVHIDYRNIGHDPETGLNLFEIYERS